MRNIIFVILLAAVVLLSGFFTVDQREVALLSNSSTPQKPSIYLQGIHWKTPFVGDLTYVYTNMRSSYLSSTQPFSLKTGQKFTSKVVINWQVVSPVTYLNYLNANSLKDLDSALSIETLKQLSLLSMQANSLQGFEELVNSNLTNLKIEKLGLKIVNIGLLSFTPSVMVTSNNSESSLLMSPESAYLLAQQIKTQADMTQQTNLAKLRLRNPQFFDYFMSLHQLGQTAKNKQDVPPFTKLFSPQQKEN